ncbi:MAG: protein kinase [Minicystis sp.]
MAQHEGQWFFTMELVHGQDLLEVLSPDGAGKPGASTVTEAATPEIAADVAAFHAGDTTTTSVPTLRQARVACNPEVFVGVIAQILDALAYLHGQGIVHRDLKPSNILVDLDGAVRVLDFGLASRLDRTLAISQEGAVVGTLAYLSPEQVRGEPASAASDLYALGCMMFQLLTGEMPFQGPAMRALTARCDEPPPRVDARVTGVPAGLATIVHRLMARDPRERPTIDAVREALGARPGPRGLGAQAGARADSTGEIFVGRQRELAVLAGGLERAAGGEATLALVAGPSGIGKSALASMLVRRAERQGFRCFRGRCYEREQVPFVAFDRVMDQMILTLRGWPPARLAPLEAALAALGRLFPAFGLLAAPAAASAADPRELRQQAVSGFRQICAVFQAEAPICFVLDDLQWTDEESVELLAALLAGNAGRIMILGLFHPHAARLDHPLGPLLRDVEAAGKSTTITLDPLGSAEAAHLVEAVTGNRLAPAVSAALASQTDGNPFLVRRLAEHLGALDPAEQLARVDALGSASDLIGELIRTLSPRAEQILALAATAGGDIAAPLLCETSGLGGEEFDLAVAELSAARFLKAAPRGPEAEAPHLDLYHDRIRQVVYQGLDADRRRALHLRLATAIEAQGRGSDAELLVRHFGGAGDRARSRRYALEAAEQAAAKLAFLHAARLYRIALDDPDPHEPLWITAARWERVGDLLEYGGQHRPAGRAYQEALRLWEAAPEDHPERAVARLRLHGLAGANLMATDRVAEGRAVFAGGLAILGLPLDRSTPERLAVLAGLEAQKAIVERLPQRSGAPRIDPLAAAEVQFFDLMVRAFMPLWPGAAAEAAARAELLGRRLDDHRVLHRSLAAGAVVPFFLGKCSPAQIERAHRKLDVADALARARDLPLGRELVQQHRGLLWLVTNPTRARRSCETALEGFARRGLASSFDGKVARAYYLYILVLKGDEDDALAAMDREIDISQQNLVSLTIALGEKTRLLAHRGRTEEAADHARRLRDHLAGVPASRLDLILARALGNVQVAEGRFAALLAERDRTVAAARASGAWAIGLDRSLWLEVQLEAALGALRRGGPRAGGTGPRPGLPAAERRHARAAATWLARRGAFDFACLGHRALAYLDHAEGRERAAREQLRRALSLSSANTAAYHRWLCLRAARDLGAITLDQEAELVELATEGRFVPPVGWGD